MSSGGRDNMEVSKHYREDNLQTPLHSTSAPAPETNTCERVSCFHSAMKKIPRDWGILAL